LHFSVPPFLEVVTHLLLLPRWPIPDGTDFQSYHTLRLLHESEEEFGPVPENEEWRHKRTGKLEDGYKWTHP
jgi:hypothetical protein